MPALGLGRVDLALPDADALGALGERLRHHGFEVRDDGRTLRSTIPGRTASSRRPPRDRLRRGPAPSDAPADHELGVEDGDVPRVPPGEQVEQHVAMRSPCAKDGWRMVVSCGVTEVATGESSKPMIAMSSGTRMPARARGPQARPVP